MEQNVTQNVLTRKCKWCVYDNLDKPSDAKERHMQVIRCSSYFHVKVCFLILSDQNH
jgi:hypothetical protein